MHPPSPGLNFDLAALRPALGQESKGMRIGYGIALSILAVYIPGSPFMYMNMVSNRKSAFKKRSLGVEGAKKAA